MANGGIDPATMYLIQSQAGLLGPNKYSQFQGQRIPIAGDKGPATDVHGNTIPSYATAAATPGVDMNQAYLDALANPGKVTTPGGYDHSSDTPSVLSAFLDTNKSGGTGAGGYSNQGFFDTLNKLQSATGATGGGSGTAKSGAQMAQDEVDARNAQGPADPTTPTAAPAAATPGTTLNSTPTSPFGSLTPRFQEGDGRDSGGRGAQLATAPGSLIGYSDEFGDQLPLYANPKMTPQGMTDDMRSYMLDGSQRMHDMKAGTLAPGTPWLAPPAGLNGGGGMIPAAQTPSATPSATPQMAQSPIGPMAPPSAANASWMADALKKSQQIGWGSPMGGSTSGMS